MSRRLPAQVRYESDPVFRRLVDIIESILHEDEGKNITPTELREAAMFACMRWGMDAYSADDDKGNQ